jgi:anti-sigma factor ChrR (cupin superfamily)
VTNLDEHWTDQLGVLESLDLAYSLPAAAPSSGLKQRLMDRLFAPPPPGLGCQRREEGRWRPTGSEGVDYKKLYFDSSTGLITMLVRMAPGSVYPGHLHTRTEQCLVLEGDLRHRGAVYEAGDFTWAEPGSVDSPSHSVRGNLLLIMADPANEIL